MQATLDDVRTESEQRYENLAQAYGELKLAWDNRGAREQDVAQINKLAQMIKEKDDQIQGFERKYNELRNVRPTFTVHTPGEYVCVKSCPMYGTKVQLLLHVPNCNKTLHVLQRKDVLCNFLACCRKCC
jgi:hypothetical protein